MSSNRTFRNAIVPAVLLVLASCSPARWPTAALWIDARWADRAGAQWAELLETHDNLGVRLKADLEEAHRVDLLPEEPSPDDLGLQGKYGRVPELRADEEPGAIFPKELAPPDAFSWRKISLRAQGLAREYARFDLQLRRWENQGYPHAERLAPLFADEWNSLNQNFALLGRWARYVRNWQPQLALSGSPEHEVLRAIREGRLDRALAEQQRPHRVLKRDFLPQTLATDPHGIPRTLIMPIATDIRDSWFLREVEGAVETHWNASYFARRHAVRFEIRWTRVPPNERLTAGDVGLDEHIRSFAPNQLGITTGGLATFVRGNVMVLGLGPLRPRTLAHEFGHLIGFEDCYFRTLAPVAGGWLGVEIQERDNPLYPDDLMCDNERGSAWAMEW